MVGYERGQYAVVTDLDVYWRGVDSPWPATLAGLTNDTDIDGEDFIPFMAGAHLAVSANGSYEVGVHKMNNAAANLLEGQPVDEVLRHTERYVNEEGPEYYLDDIIPEDVIGSVLENTDIHISGQRQCLKPDREVITGLRNLNNAGVKFGFSTDIPHPFSDIHVREGLEMEDVYLLSGSLETEDGYFTGVYTPLNDKEAILRQQINGRRFMDHGFVEGVGDSPRDLGYIRRADRGRQKMGAEMSNYNPAEICANPHVECMDTDEPRDFVDAIFSDIQRDLFSPPASGRGRGVA